MRFQLIFCFFIALITASPPSAQDSELREFGSSPLGIFSTLGEAPFPIINGLIRNETLSDKTELCLSLQLPDLIL